MMIVASVLCSLFAFLANGDDVSLVFAGDAMQHERQIVAARTADGNYDYSDYFRHVSDYISAADYAVVNLECPLGGKPYAGYPCFSAPDAYAQALKDAGFDLFLLANNHCLDRRDAGLRRTLDVLDESDIPHVGTYRDTQERQREYPFVADVKGMKIGFLNYTYGTNGFVVQGNAVVDYIDEDAIRKDIRDAKAKGAELIVACMHWGDEYKLLQNKTQERLAAFLEAEGVDLIIGGHPHVVQPMGMRVGGTLVVYSLGNFISGMRTADTRGGAMVRVTIGRRNGRPYVKDAAYRLVFVQDPAQSGDNYELIPADRPDLVRADQRGMFKRFTDRARGVLDRRNLNVPEDAAVWYPVSLFPAIVKAGFGAE